MDTQPHLHDAHDHDQDESLPEWLASEAFTHFMTLTFGAAVKQAVDEQAARGVTERR
jgi:hypothetical protein